VDPNRDTGTAAKSDRKQHQEISIHDASAEDLDIRPERALAVYGTLAPGEENYHAMLGINGTWVNGGHIRGYKFQVTWGGADGYPGVVLDPDGHQVPVMVMVSDDLDAHWRRLDDFEGPGFRRVVVDVIRDRDGETEVFCQAYVFEALTDNED